MRLRLAWLVLPLAVALPCGCDDEEPVATQREAPEVDGDPPWNPPAETCEAPDLDDVTRFTLCSTGSGIFGRWFVDDLGLPAYRYALDQQTDERASFYNTERDAEGNTLDRRDHWAAFGNSRVNAMIYNDGYVEVVTQDRGVEYLNKFDEAQGNYAGGLSWIDDGSKVWSTAYRWRRRGSRTGRVFGMGYAETVNDYRDVRVTRRTVAPWGNAPVVISDVVLENLSDKAKTLRHYEYWDVGRRTIEINWAVSGKALTTAPASARRLRDGRNALFVEDVSFDSSSGVLGVRRHHAAGVEPTPREEPNFLDYYPGDPFLVALAGPVDDVYVDQADFFGDGGVGLPAVVVERRAGKGVTGGGLANGVAAEGQPHMLAMRSDVVLAPGASTTLRFAFGYAPMGEPWEVEPAWRDPAYDVRASYAASLRERLLYFASDKDPVLHRELAWHAYQVEASAGQRDYWQTTMVPQGSAYLYLHGADGAARDLGIFAVPLVYTNPNLARAELELYMGMQFAADDRFSYAFQGHGMLDDAGIHKAPSDLPLFFLWALGEYLGATGDLAFLDAEVPFYPREARPHAVVWEHVVGALRHLFDVVGTGEHGLIRVGTGDWSDGIVVDAPDRALAVEKGESVPNTQMAVVVLPRIADLVEDRDPVLAGEIRERVEQYRVAAAAQWSGAFFYRAYYGDGKPVSASSPNLESQVWALVGDVFADPKDRGALVGAIADELDDGAPTGATLWTGGQVWPAISGLLTWGYAQHEPDRAWAHLARNTMAAHALAFPDVWYGIWSGPDGLNSDGGSRPGESWDSVVTPMVDFPVQNNNQHTMPMLAALRVAGIDAVAAGIRLAPAVPSRQLALRSALVDVTLRGNVIEARYRPTGAEARAVTVVAPEGELIESAVLNGSAVTVEQGRREVTMLVGVGESEIQVVTGK